MSQYHAGADADDETHTRDHGEGGEQACPDAPLQPQESRAPSRFTDLKSRRHVAPAQAIRLNRGGQYRVTRLTKSGAFAGFAGFLLIKAKRPALGRPFQGCVARSVPGDGLPAPVEAVIQTCLHSMLVVTESDADDRGRRGSRV